MVTDSNQTYTSYVGTTKQLSREIFRHINGQMPIEDKLDISTYVGDPIKISGQIRINIWVSDKSGEFHHPQIKSKIEYMIKEVCGKRLPPHCIHKVHWKNRYE